MDSQEVGGVLQECLAAAQRSTQPTEAERLNYCRCRGQAEDGAICSFFIWEWEEV